MFPFWGIIYGLAWIAWLVCIIGAMGNSKIIGAFSTNYQYSPSEQYLQGIQRSQKYQQSSSL